jgi:hypothetical protein
VLHMRKELDVRPRPQMRMLNVHITWCMLTEVANHLEISYATYKIIHNRLKFCKACARWIPEQLTVLHKQTCLDVCQQPNRYCNECYDKTWTHHCKPESKRQSMDWEHPQLPSKKKSKSQPSPRKLMLTTISNACYSEMLTDRL